MARKHLNYGPEEWRALPWPVQRAYLDGMEADESVPLVMQQREADDGMPEGMRWQVRNEAPAEVIDLTGMISDLEAARGAGR